MTNEALSYYHDLLTAGDTAAEMQALLAEATQQRRLSFGDRPVCNVLRPFFIGAAVYDRMKPKTDVLLRAINKLYQALMADDQLRAEMDLTELEEQLLQIPAGFPAPDVSARLDAFLDEDGGFQFVEYNAESPGGLFYGDVLGEVFLHSPAMQQFSRRYSLCTFPIRDFHLDALLDTYVQWGGRNEPRIAIVDWRTVKTYNEFLIYQDHLRAEGYESVIVDPEELTYTNGKLRAGDVDIDLVYKRVVTGELLDKYGLDHPLFDAARDGAVCVVNSFHVQMLYKKMTFVLLSDPAYAHLYDVEERAAIAEHIPWTRKLREGYTSHQGQTIDLIPFVQQNKDRLVVKPNGEYGGRGVVLGWECDQSAWEQAVAEALPDSFIVQERVRVGSEPYPTYMDGKFLLTDRYFDVDPYVWHGHRAEGCGIRLSAAALLNVSAGGGSAAPMFLIERL
jgi:uncharacterized circularly permuted ATP-grasp superfamily protein